MNLNALEESCIKFARMKCSKFDSSHDFFHAMRVLKLVKKIQKKEGGNLKILIPGALFHDIVIFPKNHKRSDSAQLKSAIVAKRFLEKNFKEYYSSNEIEQVYKIIKECSFTKNIEKTCLEGKILQDADSLESIGSIAIIRAFHSGGQMNRPFYNEFDPFCKNRTPEPKIYTLDVIYARVLKIKDRLLLQESKKIAVKKEDMINKFMLSLKRELFI